jgi:hypothetical protein
MSHTPNCKTNLFENDTKINDTKINDTKINDTKINDTKINDTKKSNESNKIEQLSETIAFLKHYENFIDAILHRINIMYNNGYKLDIESINESLFRLQCLRAISISHTTKTLNFNLKLDKKDQINFSLDWTKNVTDNVSNFLVQIYVIKKELNNKILS